MTSPLSGDSGADTIPKTADDGELVTKRVAYLADSKHNPQNPDRWAEGQGGLSTQEREPDLESPHPGGEIWRRTRDRTAGEEDQTSWRGSGGSRNEFRHKHNRKGSHSSHHPNRGARGGHNHGRKSFDDGKRSFEGSRRSFDNGHSRQDDQQSPANSKRRRDSQRKRGNVQFSPPDDVTFVENALETQDSDDEEGPGWISDPKPDI
jgi:hypothetical protein